MSIINLKDIIEDYARQFFKSSEKPFYRRIGRQTGWKDLRKEIDWKRLSVRSETAQYKDICSVGHPKSHVLFRSSYINDTINEQEYQLRTERKTVSTCELEIFEGFVTEVGAELKLEIPIPGCVLEGATTFKQEYSLENTTTKSIEEEISWSVESNIKVPSMTRTTAELLVKEDEYKGAFEIKTYFKGGVSVKLYKDHEVILHIELDDLEEIFTGAKGFAKDNKGLFHMTRGECKARFGIEQKIELHQNPL